MAREKQHPNLKNSVNTLAIPRPTWQIWGIMGLIIFTIILFLYQNSVFKGYKLNIADVKSQGVIFDHYRTDFEQSYNEYPLWYPYIFCGMPFHASGTYRIRYTLETLYQLIPSFIRSSLNPAFTLNLLLGGIFMLILLRSYGLGYLPALGGALAFILTTKLLGTPHTNRIVTFIHIPLIFYALRQIIETRKWIYIIILGGALGSQIGSYHPQVAYYTLLMIGLYGLYRFVQAIQSKENWQSIGSWVLMVTIGLAIAYFMASIVLMPMREYLPFSIRGGGAGAGSGGGLSADYATAWSFSWMEIGSFFLPAFNGFGGNTYWGDSPFTSYPHYLGMSVIILAVIGFWKNRHHRDFWFWCLLLVFSLLISMGKNLSVLSNLLLNYLPYFNKFREPSMILILFILGIAILAGFGLEAVGRKINSMINDPKWIKVFLRGLIAAGVLALVAVLFKGMLNAIMTGFYQSADQASGRLAQFPDQRQVAMLYQMRFDAFFQDYWLMLIFAAATMGIIWAGLKKMLSENVATGLLIIILVVDLAIPGSKVIKDMFSPVTQQNMTPIKTPAIDFLQKQPGDFRVFPVDELSTNRYAYYGIASVGGYHAAKMQSYQDMLAGNFLNNFNFLRMTNTHYLVTQKQLQTPILQLIQRAGNENIYALNGALPRAWFVDSVVVQADPEQVLAFMQTPDFDPAKMVIVEEDPGYGLSNHAYSGVVKTTKHDPQLYEFETTNESGGMFVLSEAGYAPGWQATVDGQPVEVFQANHFLQAIWVPAGDHKVTFNFHSGTFSTALWLSRILFYGVIFTLIGYVVFTKLKQQKTITT